MAHVNDKVLAAVEASLKEKPDATVDELFAMARDMDSSLGELSKRQFHARYPLQIKRKMNPGKRRKRRRAKTTVSGGGRRGRSANSREAVRSSFLEFASELAAAEARKDVVRVVANVDRYVDEVLEATGGR